MATNYYEKITDTLHGKTPELSEIPEERLDWSGLTALLKLFHKTSGQDRQEIIQAMGQIIEGGEEPPHIIAQLLQIVSSLDLAELEPSVERLEEKYVAQEEPLRSAISNFKAYRKLNTQSRTESAVPHGYVDNQAGAVDPFEDQEEVERRVQEMIQGAQDSAYEPKEEIEALLKDFSSALRKLREEKAQKGKARDEEPEATAEADS